MDVDLIGPTSLIRGESLMGGVIECKNGCKMSTRGSEMRWWIHMKRQELWTDEDERIQWRALLKHSSGRRRRTLGPVDLSSAQITQ